MYLRDTRIPTKDEKSFGKPGQRPRIPLSAEGTTRRGTTKRTMDRVRVTLQL